MSSTCAFEGHEPDPRRRLTIPEFFALFGEIHSTEELKTKLDEVDRRIGTSELTDELITWKIEDDRIYLLENKSSTYALLGSQRYGSLPHEKSSICGALKRAEALIELTGPIYRRNMIEYLERHGPASGQGIFDAAGEPLGFSREDFALHKTKLIPLHELVKSGDSPNEPDWDRFFDLGFLEYKEYCFSKSKKNPGGSFAADPNNRRDSNRPGGADIDQADASLSELDPFSGHDIPRSLPDAVDHAVPISIPIRAELPRLSIDTMPVGSIPQLPWLLPPKPSNASHPPLAGTSPEDPAPVGETR